MQTFKLIGQVNEHGQQMLLDLAGDGWYTQRPQRRELDWLRKQYPRGAG